MRPRLLDLFCGAGGAAMGYHRAGFDVVGVDIHTQPRYPFEFHQADALLWPLDQEEWPIRFDAVHASPPCQAHTALRTMPTAKKHPNLIPATRRLLKEIGLPYVIENVPGAPLRKPGILCGTMFGLGVADGYLRRHRLFETNWPLSCPTCAHPNRMAITVTGTGQAVGSRRCVNVWGHPGGQSRRSRVKLFTSAECREAMGIDWMLHYELVQSIPPAYTEFIGKQLLAVLR